MADISYIQKEDLEDSDEAMEIEDDDDVEGNLSHDDSGPGILDSLGGSGDEGGRDEQLLKLQQYATSEANYTRQRVGRILVDMFRSAVNNGTKLVVSDIMQSVQQIIDDPDAQVRSDLVEQLPHVAMICQEASHLFGDVLHDHLLDIVIKYLRDPDNQVRLTAQTAVLTLIQRGLLDNNTIETKICPVVEVLTSMSADFLNSVFRYTNSTVPPIRVVVMWCLRLISQPALMSGTARLESSGCATIPPVCRTLMSKMAPLIGKELTEKMFLDRYIALCENNEFFVRKICVSHFAELCTAVGRKALFRRLFPIFIDLCCDRVWGVRKACADVMMPVSCCLTLQHRRLLLAEILATYLHDESKWVRMSAFQILGPFISTFAKQFTEVTYNQYGELVFTSQQDTHFSIRYSYEGIFPTKCAIRSHTLDTEDYNSKENFFTSAITQNVVFEDEVFETESQEDHISTIRAYKSKIQKMDDMEKYNPFLYYYIPPDLPLDDELVKAAKKSTAESTAARKAANTATTEATSLNSDSFNEENYANYAFPEEFEMILSNGQEIVPQHLIDSFLSMAKPQLCPDSSSADIPHHCAFSFPAVALTLGKENWHYLKHAYQSLASANQWKVRRTLASSIHEIALILGEELTATDLVPIYDGFIKDLDEVRIGVLKHLATFLKILKPSDRCQYLPRLEDFLATDNEWNWRFREELATQLLEAVNLFSPTDVERHIVPLSLQLLADKVAAVRHVALSLVTQIVAHLSDSERLVKFLFQELRYTLGVYAKKWIRRQTYACVCAQLISSNAISGDRFVQEMLSGLLKLSSDKVPNVRLAVARTLSRNVITMGPDWLGVEHAEEVERRLKEMRLDPDRDVRVLAGGDEHPVLNILSQNKTEQSRNILF